MERTFKSKFTSDVDMERYYRLTKSELSRRYICNNQCPIFPALNCAHCGRVALHTFKRRESRKISPQIKTTSLVQIWACNLCGTERVWGN